MKGAFSRKLIKYTLLLLSLGGLGSLLAWSHLEALWTPDAPASLEVSASCVTSQDVTNPQFISHDAQGHIFQIGAEKGTHYGTNHVTLTKVEGTLEAGDQTITLQAQEGQINPTQRDRALLKGNVELHHTGHYHVHTQSAEVDFNGGAVRTNSPVKATAPYGTIQSQRGAKFDQHNETVDLYGPAQATFYGTLS